GVKASNFEYILWMAIGSLTLEKVEELCAEKDKLIDEVDELKGSTLVFIDERSLRSREGT
ncbi:hypothetical protein GIB67_018317, partial [Kingdonia uniflora]